MTDCCETLKRNTPCRSCGSNSHAVETKTVVHHIVSPLSFNGIDESVFYFCSNPLCDIVYFTVDQSYEYKRQDIIGVIGQKSTANDRPICYCFNVSACDASSDHGRLLKEKIISFTQSKLCACEIRNPSGKCCLAEFAKIEKEIK